MIRIKEIFARVIPARNSEKQSGLVVTVGLLAFYTAGLAACASSGLYQIELMPAPGVYKNAVIDPFADAAAVGSERDLGILYATDRQPLKDLGKGPYYANERGYVLRLGIAQVEYFGQGLPTEKARRASLMKHRTEKLQLTVGGVQEFGVLKDSITVFDTPAASVRVSHEPARRFASLVNERLAQSNSKDIFVYVHGYNINFENPVLVAAELWHFLGYEGAMIAYAWPATESVFAYSSDVETAQLTARNLRILLTLLARDTRARRIHVVGYSAGTRIVAEALTQLAMIHATEDSDTLQEKLRIGQVMLIGSDVDRGLIGGHLADSLLKVPAHLNVYLSDTDKALGLSSWVFQRKRLGQTFTDEEMLPGIKKFLRETENIAIIDVTDAERAAVGNGHWYFRDSPWVSSDVLVTLRYQLSPPKRGLIRSANWPIWRFPEDYISCLRASLWERKRKVSISRHGSFTGSSQKSEQERPSDLNQDH